MAGRSYLRRVAQPLAPGDARLVPIRAPLADEAWPSIADAAPRPASASERPGRIASPASLQRTETHRAAATPDAPSDDAGEPEAGGFITGKRQAGEAVEPGGLEAAGVEPARRSRAPLSPAEPGSQESFPHIAPAQRPAPRRAEFASERLKLRIGTIEVRMHPAPPPPAPAPRTAEAARPAAPLARGLAWRYGLVQG
jgi:hypothetical protein